MIPVRGLRDAQNSQNPPDCQEQIKAQWAQVPAFCRFIFIATTGLYLTGWITTALLALLYNQPQKVIYEFQIWRVLTGSLVHAQLLQLLFSLMSYMPTAMQQEKMEGTVKQTFRFLLTSLLIEVLFVLACFALSLTVSAAFLKQPSIGLWPILFCDIVVECNRSPELARGLCCLPIQIKSKYYPLVLLGLFTVFFGLQVDLFIGMGVGYMHIYGMLAKFEVSTQKAKSWEARLPFKLYATNSCFVSADASTGSSSLPTFVRTNPPSQNTRAQQQQQQSQPQTQAFQAFQGRGVSLGQSTGPSSVRSSTSSTSTQSSTQKPNLAGKSALVDQTGKFKKPTDALSNTTMSEDNEGHEILHNEGEQYNQVQQHTDEDDEIDPAIKVNLI